MLGLHAAEGSAFQSCTWLLHSTNPRPEASLWSSRHCTEREQGWGRLVTLQQDSARASRLTGAPMRLGLESAASRTHSTAVTA